MRTVKMLALALVMWGVVGGCVAVGKVEHSAARKQVAVVDGRVYLVDTRTRCMEPLDSPCADRHVETRTEVRLED